MNMIFFKYIKWEIYVILSNIFNRCLVERIFPSVIEKAKIIPLYKSGSKYDMLNFRPISLMPQIAKLYEKAIKYRLNKFLEKYNIIHKSQCGFRSGIMTADVIECINENLEKLKKCALDLKKAFDTIDHDILYQKLEYYGIRVQHWIYIKVIYQIEVNFLNMITVYRILIKLNIEYPRVRFW